MTITEESLRDGVKTNYDLDKTYVCLGRNDIAGMYSREKNLIFIDRFDTIAIDSKTHEVNQKLIDFINKSNNIFVIMTRGTISGIKCRYSDIYELHSEKVNGIVKIYTE
ncbi:MAG: hypothetical protein IJ593_10635 [Lachnospiraceae bacterium]|nr:hypothetical protein [Lachnospiraceae bacterium]